jgi:transcriptional regulator with XRE-family HTH domain
VENGAMVDVALHEHPTADSGLDIVALGQRIREERMRQEWSLDDLAASSGVSRSMLSAVERGAKAPTILVLHRIATGLGSNVTRLLGEERAAPVIVLRREEQDVARDPSGWERRNLAPVLPGVDFELMRTTIPPGVDAGEFPPHPPGSREYVAVEQGTLDLTVAGAVYLLHEGDSIYYEGECRHAFANPGPETCVYYLALEVPGRGRSNRHVPHSRGGTKSGDGQT